MRRTTPRQAPADVALDRAAVAGAARDVAAGLPLLLVRAEAGGLSLVAQHLRRALEIAERVAAAGAAPDR